MRRSSIGAGLCLAAIGLFSTVGVAAATVDPMGFFDQSLGDFGEELEIAREEGKKGVLLFFQMDECPFCP